MVPCLYYTYLLYICASYIRGYITFFIQLQTDRNNNLEHNKVINVNFKDDFGVPVEGIDLGSKQCDHYHVMSEICMGWK